MDEAREDSSEHGQESKLTNPARARHHRDDAERRSLTAKRTWVTRHIRIRHGHGRYSGRDVRQRDGDSRDWMLIGRLGWRTFRELMSHLRDRGFTGTAQVGLSSWRDRQFDNLGGFDHLAEHCFDGNRFYVFTKEA
jgi:hypothetical protein